MQSIAIFEPGRLAERLAPGPVIGGLLGQKMAINIEKHDTVKKQVYLLWRPMKVQISSGCHVSSCLLSSCPASFLPSWFSLFSLLITKKTWQPDPNHLPTSSSSIFKRRTKGKREVLEDGVLPRGTGPDLQEASWVRHSWMGNTRTW